MFLERSKLSPIYARYVLSDGHNLYKTPNCYENQE